MFDLTPEERKQRGEQRRIALREARTLLQDLDWRHIYYEGGEIDGLRYPAGKLHFELDHLHPIYNIIVQLSVGRRKGNEEPGVFLETIDAFRKGEGGVRIDPPLQ